LSLQIYELFSSYARLDIHSYSTDGWNGKSLPWASDSRHHHDRQPLASLNCQYLCFLPVFLVVLCHYIAECNLLEDKVDDFRDLFGE
jgi:hypothetical protein